MLVVFKRDYLTNIFLLNYRMDDYDSYFSNSFLYWVTGIEFQMYYFNFLHQKVCFSETFVEQDFSGCARHEIHFDFVPLKNPFFLFVHLPYEPV